MIQLFLLIKYRSGSPAQLTELVHRASVENLSLEVLEPVRVIYLVASPRYTGHHISEIIIIIIFNIIKSIHLHIILIIIKSKTIVTFQWDPTLHQSTSVHMKCSPPPMLVKSLVSTNSSTPFMPLSPARMMNCPVGDQNR